MRVLVIDDDEIDRTSARRALMRSDASIRVVERSNAADGLAEFEREAYDAVLLDYRLPDADGLETLHRLRAGAGSQCAVLMLSGMDDEGLAERCLEEGAQDYLLKDDLGSRHLHRALVQARHRFRLEENLRRSHEEIRTLAEHDPLTGLANRRFFDDSLHAAMPLALRHGHPLALLLLDIDHFKNVNDSYGHDAGDVLLREVARRLMGTLRGGDLLCRLGGDEFAVLGHDFDSPAQANHLAQRLLAAMSRPIRVGAVDVNCTVSIGVVCYPSGANTAEELMKHADLAMYRSKKAGRNQVSFFSQELNTEAVRRMTLERELRVALDRQGFELHYQPQYGGPGDGIVAIEALLRWRHPQRGLLGPIEFLDVAEDSGLIVPIGEWVLREACQQARHWRRAARNGNGVTPVLSVNLSAAQLRNDNLVGLVDETLKENGMQPDALELEITENAIVGAPTWAAKVLGAFVDMGASVALDDFGTGFSSLSHLRAFPIGVLKLDKSLVHGAASLKRDERLLMSVLAMARNLGLRSVVEGIETAEHESLARRHGADRLQGFLFARALPPAEMDLLLATAA
jgi:diguanylate cyclase